MIGDTEALRVEHPLVPARASRALVDACCCVCDDDDAEPIAVGEDFDAGRSAEMFLAMRCNSCGLIYLAPRPADAAPWRLGPDASASRRSTSHARTSGLARGVRHQVMRVARMLPRDGAALEIGCGDGARLHSLREILGPRWSIEGLEPHADWADIAEGRGFPVHRVDVDELDPVADYDLVLITDTLSEQADPVGVLSNAASRLRPGGRVVIVVENTDTTCFRVFRGRHWAGYHFPRRWYFFSPHSLSLLAGRAGLRVSHLETAAGTDHWVRSIWNLMVDWRLPRRLAEHFGPAAVTMPALFGLVEGMERLRGHGALLVAACRPAE
jgi:SAM-dependent methyltransferase